MRPSSVAPDPAESRGAPPPPQDPSPLRGTLGPGWPQLRSRLPFGPRSQASLQKAQGPGVCMHAEVVMILLKGSFEGGGGLEWS